MLQDLDKLATRIRQVVALLQQARAESEAQAVRIQGLEEQHRRLREQAAQDQKALVQANEQLAEHEKGLQVAHLESERLRKELEDHLQDSQGRAQALAHQLERAVSERDRLRAAATGAQQQIELILERLPGAEN
ncbi:hypothetical protein [Castellaniella sp.]|uniref:hypothetical protein n=1 Tax=Castellaniella sp. TaxID=1955812 RepID=UPI00355F0A49